MLGLDTFHTTRLAGISDSSVKRWGRTVALGLLILASSGCFRYVSVPLETVSVGDGVRLVVTRDGAAEYREVTGAEEVLPVVTGTLTERSPSSLVLLIPVAARQAGFHQVGIDAAVQVPVNEVLDASRRELNLFGTGALALGAAGLTVLVVRQILTAVHNSTSDPGNDIDESVTATPIFRIPVGR